MKLSVDDRERIYSAIAKAGARTDVRFAVAIIPASDRYTHYPVVWSAALALMVGTALALLRPEISLRYGIMIELIVFAAFALVFDWYPFRLLLVSKRVKRDYARNFARREFAARVLSPHDGRGGLLFFVSLGERYVEILATHDIHSKVGVEAWNGLVADFVASAKADCIASGALSAIDGCASHLATHFPKSA